MSGAKTGNTKAHLKIAAILWTREVKGVEKLEASRLLGPSSSLPSPFIFYFYHLQTSGPALLSFFYYIAIVVVASFFVDFFFFIRLAAREKHGFHKLLLPQIPKSKQPDSYVL